MNAARLQDFYLDTFSWLYRRSISVSQLYATKLYIIVVEYSYLCCYWLGVPPGCILSSKQYTLLGLPTLHQVCGQVINPSHCYRKYLTFQKGSSACTEMSFHVQSKTENLPFFETDFSSSPSAALLQSFGGFRCSYVTDAIAKLYM